MRLILLTAQIPLPPPQFAVLSLLLLLILWGCFPDFKGLSDQVFHSRSRQKIPFYCGYKARTFLPFKRPLQNSVLERVFLRNCNLSLFFQVHLFAKIEKSTFQACSLFLRPGPFTALPPKKDTKTFPPPFQVKVHRDFPKGVSFFSPNSSSGDFLCVC